MSQAKPRRGKTDEKADNYMNIVIRATQIAETMFMVYQ